MCRLPPLADTFSVSVPLVNVALTRPLCAAPPVPSIVALQLMAATEIVPWIFVMVMLATFVVALYAVALSGIFPVIVAATVNTDALQPLKASDVRVPMLAPARPLPFLSVPFMTEDVQVTGTPLVASVTTVFPAVPVTAPPGLTVQLAAARASAAAKPITDAAVALMTRALPQALRIALTSFLCRSPDAWQRSGRCLRSSPCA